MCLSVCSITFLCLIDSYSFFDYNNLFLKNNYSFIWLKYVNIINYPSNLYLFGIALYNYYYLFVIISGLILYLAMIGSILIVLDTNRTVVDIYDNSKRKCILKNYRLDYVTKLSNKK
jgi:hypothetical protein